MSCADRAKQTQAPATETMNIPCTGVAQSIGCCRSDRVFLARRVLGKGGNMKDLRSSVAVRLLAAASSVTAIVLVVGAGVKF